MTKAREMLELATSIEEGHVRVVHLNEYTQWAPYKTTLVVEALRLAAQSQIPTYFKYGRDISDRGDQPQSPAVQTISLPLWAAEDILKYMRKIKVDKEAFHPLGLENLLDALVSALTRPDRGGK